MTAAKEITAVPMTSVEETRLVELEAVVSNGLDGFLAVGAALIEIRDGGLYRATHGAFAQYLVDRWEISESRGYQLIAAAHVATIVEAAGLSPLANEAQARELVGLDAHQVVEVINQAVTSTGGKPTARAIRLARLPLGPVPSGSSTPRPSTSTSPSQPITSATVKAASADFFTVLTTVGTGLSVNIDWSRLTPLDAAKNLEKIDALSSWLAGIRKRLVNATEAVCEPYTGRPARLPITIVSRENSAFVEAGWAITEAFKRLGIQTMPDVQNPKGKRRAFPARHLDDVCAALEADGHRVEVVAG